MLALHPKRPLHFQMVLELEVEGHPAFAPVSSHRSFVCDVPVAGRYQRRGTFHGEHHHACDWVTRPLFTDYDSYCFFEYTSASLQARLSEKSVASSGQLI